MSEVTIEWIEALAANDFNQAQGSMCSAAGSLNNQWDNVKPTDGFCCLGVRRFLDVPESTVCNVLGAGEPMDWEREAFGLTGEGMGRLIMLNDSGRDFPYIARQILSDPDYYLAEEEADAVKEYFWEG